MKIKPVLSAILALLLIHAADTPVAAQQAPFDMSPERPAPERDKPPQSPDRLESEVPSSSDASSPSSPSSDAPLQPSTITGEGTVSPAVSPGSEPTTAAPEAGQPSTSTGFRRYVVPMDKLVLSGEIATRSWSISVTPEQAASKASIQVGYQNAIVVAPEASRFQVFINDTEVIDEQVSSPEDVKDVADILPTGLLRSGANIISFRTSLRHRTDCTIASTYDLWTEIDPARTFLTFDDRDSRHMRRVEDIRAIGVDATGQTRFTLVVPDGDIAPMTQSLVTLSEGLSLLARMPNQTTAIVEGKVPEEADGSVTVLVGTDDEIKDLGVAIPASNVVRPAIEFLHLSDDPDPDRTVIVINANDRNTIDAAILALVSPNARPLTDARKSISQSSWQTPDAPFFLIGGNLSFADLGVKTQEFSGRRFRTTFTIGVPADFYAQAYGEMTILLDAAYTDAVLPDSHLDVYVNGNIATTLPIGDGGTVLRAKPIEITMQHLKPGINEVALEAILLTSTDAACLPGSNASDNSRFAIFDTSRLKIPDFARISSRPDLAQLQGLGYPYNRATKPVSLLLGSGGYEVASAAATLLGRMSVVADRPIAFSTRDTASAATGKNAIFIGTVQQIPAGVLNQVGIAEDAKTAWGSSGSVAASDDSRDAIARWNEEVGQSGWRQPFIALRRWLSDKFDISFDELRLTPSMQAAFTPPPTSTFLIAEGQSPTNEMMWTLATAPKLSDLRSGMNALASHDVWSQLGGRVTIYTDSTRNIFQGPAGSMTLVQSQPFSFSNFRLIAANWLSQNVLSYAALLAATALLLGIATTAITSVLGRRR